MPALPVRAAVDLDPLSNVVHADLLAEQDAVVPGGSITLGLRLRHAPHWHTYWIIPGDAGLPTRLRWTLDPGYAAGPLLWPAPQRLSVGSLANYGYEGEVLLPVVVQVPAGARLGSTAHFAAHADWLVCNDLCIPGGADLSLNLPVQAAADVRPAAEAGSFAVARQRLPQPLARGQAQASADAKRVRLEMQGSTPVKRTLEFFPLEAGRIIAAAEQKLTLTGPDRVRLDLAPLTPEEPGFTQLRGVLVADGGPQAGGWVASVDLPLRGAAPAAAAGTARSGDGGARGAPSATAPALATPGAESAAASIAGAGAAPAPDSAAQTSGAARAPIDATASAPGAVLAPDGRAASAGFSLAGSLVALAGAFLGGLILNLMPCVFPVLSLKLMALVQHRGETRARLRGHGIAFTSGVVLSFLALAGLLLVLREAGSQIGWGFQLQSPLVIGALTGLFFLIGLNLLGTFEFTLGAGLANSRAAQALDGNSGTGGDGGLRGSFATGVLAAVIASPCTAPFMGAALGFAVTQSAPVALLVFAALGAGMAAPYLALTFFPAWLQRLPRPGAWMERLKQFMAFPMFLTCVWLFWVLGLQIGMDAAAWMLAALVGLALFAWSAGLAQRGSAGFRWLAGAAAVVAALTLLPLARSAAQAGPAAHAEGAWTNWTPLAQRAALAGGHPVFVDFTAAWCITCQANRRLVLGDEKVERALRGGGVVLMEADWTRRDEAISQELNRFGRSGVPMYVLYDRGGVPHLLPEILSTEGLLAALAAL